jgi:hypothetical protein
VSTTALAFVAAFFAFSVLAFIRHPIWGLFAYVLTFYMGPDTAWWGYVLPNLRWSMTSALITLVAVLVYKAPVKRTPWYKFRPIPTLIVFTVWLWIQTPWALSTSNHIFLATLFTKYILMFALIYACLDSKERVHQFVIAHIIGCFWWGIEAWQIHTGGRLESIGTGDVTGSAFASMHVSTALALAGFMFLGFRGWKRWVPFIAIPFILNSIILMQTRAAFVGMLAAAPIAFLLGPPAKRSVVMVYLLLGAGLLLTVADQAFWERMGTIKVAEPEQLETSAASRFEIGKANLAMARDYPLGLGHRGNDLLSPRYLDERWLTATGGGSNIRSAHNTTLAVLVDHSMIGLLLIVLFHKRLAQSILQIRRRAWNARNQQAMALAAGLATGLVMYWINGQFANMTKAEVVIWIAAITASIASEATAPESAKTNAQIRGRYENKQPAKQSAPEAEEDSRNLH